VVKEMTYEVCPGCEERVDVHSVRKHRDAAGGAM
jgi:hypothetical protein